MTTTGEGLLAGVRSHATAATSAGSAGPSITSTDSFAVRAQRSEARRVILWSAVLVTVLALTILRRMLGGVVMAENRLFWPAVGVLTLAIAGQVVLWRTLTFANRQSRLLPPWLWRASAVG